MASDATAYLIAAAALAVFATQYLPTHQALQQCKSEFEGFKEGVIYGK